MSENQTTWYDIKDATLRKMFSLSGSTIKLDNNTKEYLYAMPQACNEALQMLATVGKFLVGKKTFIVEPLQNLLSATNQDFMLADNHLNYMAAGAKSYYFRATKGVVLNIYVDGILTDTVTCEDDNYTPYKGLITNPSGADVMMDFYAQYPAHVMNIAMYSVSYASADDVQPNEEVLRYNLKEMIPDFYQIYAGEVYIEKDGAPRYLAANEYYTEANDTIVFRSDKPGIYTVYYKRYPNRITQATEDDYVLPLDPEVAAIIPLYIASQLYKDDDNGIATTYRNEFETAFDRLKQKVEVPGREEFTSVTGWT
jgi:hypothetical protein